jgi:hypothetical protein
MTRPRFKTTALVATTLLALAGCARPDPDAPTRAAFEAGLRTFLAAGHDQVCLGLYDWPIDLTEAEAGAHSRHAVQLPVFEKLGLARSSIVSVPRSAENPDGALKRYELTGEGRKYYRAHAYTGRDRVAHGNDFCVARLSLGRVENWRLDARDAQHPSAAVGYTYRIDPAPWLADADARRVLPMVDKVIQGAAGGLQMHQGFTRDATGWVAVAGPV